MIRLLLVSFLLAGSVALLAESQAFAQSPDPALLAPPLSRAGLAPPAPPPLRSTSTQPSTSVHVPHSNRTVHIPAGAPFKTFGDRVATCTHYGAASGLRGGRLSTFTATCAN
jgi:hypothetical protein